MTAAVRTTGTDQKARASSQRPAISARRAPMRAISSEPGIANSASMKGVIPVRTPIAFSFMARSRWISGIRGGTQSTVIRRSAPAVQRRARNPRWGRVAGLGPAGAADGLQRSRVLQRGEVARLQAQVDGLHHPAQDLG